MKAILFDFDGTIIDSQKIINEFVKQKLKEKNIILNEEEQKLVKGMSLKDFTKWIEKNKQTKINKEELRISKKIENQIPLIKDARKILAQIKSRGYKTAIVTNSPRDYVDHLVKKHQLNMFFDTIITEDDSKMPKPNPKMLEMAAQKLSVKETNCAIIDDSNTGIIAGNKLDMITIKLGEKTKIAKYEVEKISQLTNLLEKIHFSHR